MTTRLTPARQAPAVLGRLSTMCCSHLVPGDQQRVQRGHDTQNPSGCPILLSRWHHLQKRCRDSESIQSPAGRTEHPLLLQAAAKVLQWEEELRMTPVLRDIAESPQCFSPQEFVVPRPCTTNSGAADLQCKRAAA